jgi:hypothetical protein
MKFFRYSTSKKIWNIPVVFWVLGIRGLVREEGNGS